MVHSHTLVDGRPQDSPSRAPVVGGRAQSLAMDENDEKKQRHSATDRDRIISDVHDVASGQGGVVSRRQAYQAGMTRGEVRAQVRARRWQRVWSRSLCIHTGDISALGREWGAVFEGGDHAVLDGESSLIASGLQRYESTTLRVSVPRGVKPLSGTGLDIRRTRRLKVTDRVASGVPRTKVEIAAVRAALWAVSDKQAALLVTMAVQQGLTTAERVGEALLRVRRDKRRAMLHDLILDLMGGARSMGELDFARACRRRGLPEPTRQVIRSGRGGRYYLDVYWEQWHLVVEIDGIHHSWADNVVSDALRHNEVAIAGDTVLRLPLLGLRLAEDDFFEQIERALRDAGWAAAA